MVKKDLLKFVLDFKLSCIISYSGVDPLQDINSERVVLLVLNLQGLTVHRDKLASLITGQVLHPWSRVMIFKNNKKKNDHNNSYDYYKKYHKKDNFNKKK